MPDTDGRYDVIIVGAGPAGATAARLLAPRFSVLLLEARQITPSAIHPPQNKCCGGLLAPDAQDMLCRMGLSLPDFVREQGQPLTVRAVDLESGRSRRYPRQYINLKRLRFEQWLISLMPETADVLERAEVVEAAPRADGWRVVFRDGDGCVRQCSCTHLIGADGAGGVVRKALGAPPRAASRYVAVQDRHDGVAPGGGSEYVAFFHPGITDFYGWVIPKADHALLGIALPPAGRRRGTVTGLLAKTYAALAAQGMKFSPEAAYRQACRLERPGVRDIFLGRGTGYCVGEAAGLISPSSAEGFSYAFSSSVALSESLIGAGKSSALAAYRIKMLSLYGNILLKTIKSAIMYTPALRGMIMRSGVLAEKI
jgi:flavin-dependent dehydrogenase